MSVCGNNAVWQSDREPQIARDTAAVVVATVCLVVAVAGAG